MEVRPGHSHYWNNRARKKCSLRKIHTANWLTKSPDHLDEFLDWSQSNLLFSPCIRLDPTIDRAIELIAASGYACKTGGKIALTEEGERFFKQLEHDKKIMELEKKVLITSKKYLSEAAVERISKAN